MATEQSAMLKTPTEIWWSILEYIIAAEHVSACAYGGGNWSTVAQECLQIKDWKWEYRSKKRQIRALRMVCKSWKWFLDSVLPTLERINYQNRYGDLSVDRISHAETLFLKRDYTNLFHLTGKTVQWRILHIHRRVVEKVKKIIYPHLRRLELNLSYYDYYPSLPYHSGDIIVDSLIPFTNIVWLSCHAEGTGYMDYKENDERQAVTLSKLQVLQYRGEGAFHLPFDRLNLPSLRHLAIQAQFNLDSLPVWQMAVDLYGNTLHSLYIGSLRGGFTFRQEVHPYFPDWSEVPHLRELALEAPICLRFHPLPVFHPLRVFAAEIWMAERLPDWLNSVNLEVIRMLCGSREPDGRLVHIDRTRFEPWNMPNLPNISSSDMELIDARADSRGIIIRLWREASGRS